MDMTYDMGRRSKIKICTSLELLASPSLTSHRLREVLEDLEVDQVAFPHSPC